MFQLSLLRDGANKLDGLGVKQNEWVETERSAVLHSYDMLDTPREQDFDDLANVASQFCETPIAVVNLVDSDRQFFKAEVGLGVRETPLETGFCQHAILSEDILVIPDATKDHRFDCNPLVTGEPGLRAYAGALLKSPEGLPIGTVCVLDYRPREFTQAQVEMLRFIARQAMAQLELRRTVAQQRQLLRRAKSAEREKANFERVVRQASDFIGMADAQGHVVFLNDAARIMVGLSADAVLRTSIWDYIADEHHQIFREEVIPLIRAGESCERELRLRHFGTGASVPALYTIFPMRDEVGELLGYGFVTKDISAQKAEEQRRTEVMGEAAHRIKNTLAVVQAIVSQTLKTATSLEQGRESISKRVAALASAQDILTAAEGSVADIVDVIASAMAPHDGGHGRVVITGPSRLLIASQALGLSLALHELATNAAKYGALSGENGSVGIEWSVSSEGAFLLEWVESGGPAVLKPSGTGFGSKLIQKMVGPYFQGAATLDFAPEGVRFRLEGRLPEAV